MQEGSVIFRQYLRTLPEELLESVTEDYIWLAGQGFGEAGDAEFARRREDCRQECLRRGVLELYREAEEIVCGAAL